MSDIRKFMNLMESSLMETSETTNLIFIDYGDGEDLAYSFASSDDADIFRTMEETQLENSRYSDQPAVKPSSHTLDKVVPAGYLAKFKSIFDEELDDEELVDYYFKMVEMLEPYAVPLSELEEGQLDEASSIHGMDTDAVLDTIFEYGMNYGIAMKSHNQTKANEMSRKSKELIKQAVSIIGERLPMKHSPITMLDSINESMDYHKLESVLWDIYLMGTLNNESKADRLVNELLEKLADRPHGVDFNEAVDENIRTLPIYSTFVDASRNMSKEDLLDVIVDAWRNGYRITPKTLNRRNPD